MNIFEELGLTGREATSDLTGLIHLMDAKGKRLPDAAGMALFHDHWNELRAGLLKADAEIKRLKAEIEGIYEDAAGEDI